MRTTVAQRLTRIMRNGSRLVSRHVSAKSSSSTSHGLRFLLILSVLLSSLFLLHQSLTAKSNPVLTPPAFEDHSKTATSTRIILLVPPITNDVSSPKPRLALTPPIHSLDSLSFLLRSIEAAEFSSSRVNLEVVLAPTPNRTEFEAVYTLVSRTSWSYGSFSVRNVTSGGLFDLFLSAWQPSQYDTEDAILIDAARTPPLSRSFFIYLQNARRYFAHADVVGFTVHPLTAATSDNAAVVKSQEATYVSVFSPLNADVWRYFRRWFDAHRNEWFLWPVVFNAKDKSDARWDEYSGNTRAHWSMWLARFSVEYELYMGYPANQLEGLGRYKWNMIGERRNYRGVVEAKRSGMVSEENVAEIVRLGRGRGSVSLTVVNEAFLETVRSWLCNVDVAGIRPPGIVWITTDDAAYEGLKDVNGSVAIRMSEFRGGRSSTGTSYGTPGYWRLMLERTMLIGEILKQGIGVFAFEGDQIWLRDPVRFVKRVIESGDEVDIVGTMDTRHEIGGNFLYLNPTLSTRRTWNEVCARFNSAYTRLRMDGHSKKYRRYMENDQSTLTKLVLFDEAFKKINPTVFRSLDTQLFVDGRWYKGRTYYHSEASRSPVMINNNFLIGIENKKQRAIEHGHWFLKEDGQCDSHRVRAAITENEKRAGGRLVGVGGDTEADVDSVLKAIDKETS